jgi:hypothetical protein
MLGDKKKTVNLILGDKEGQTEGVESALEMIADDLISAVQNGDRAGVAQALRAAIMDCQSAPEGE